MEILRSPQEYLFNLHTTSSGDARRIWRQKIKEGWENKCAYCESKENLTIDHIVPQSKGGLDETHNVVCCCHSCNQSKGHTHWKDWYETQDFFTTQKMSDIVKWMNQNNKIDYVVYRPYKNNTIF